MTRILVQRGSSSNSNRFSQQSTAPQTSQPPNESDQNREVRKEPSALDDPVQQFGSSRGNASSDDENLPGSYPDHRIAVGVDPENFKHGIDEIRDTDTLIKDLDGSVENTESSPSSSSQVVTGRSYPPPPPVPPPKPSATMASRRKTISGSPNADSRRASTWPVVATRSSPSNSKPSSPKSVGEAEGYNSADEQNTCFVSSYGDVEREHLFEIEIKRVKGLEVKRMVEDGNCLFRAVADQIYGDAESYDMARQLCIDYMERESDHFSQFITEGFVSYCKRKRRDKVYGNNVEIQVFSEMYNRPIHIYSYSTEPINIFHGAYRTDTPPLRLSYHHGNHYNSLVDPRRLSIGAGLGLSSLQGANIGKDQVKAAIKAQQDQQIDNALLAEGRFYSDLEYTETEIEQMVIEASRIEYLEEQKFKQQQQLDPSESSTSISEPSSSGKGIGQNISNSKSGNKTRILPKGLQNESLQMMLSMGFSYLQASEAYNIFGDDVDSMICYLLDVRGSSNSCSGNKNSRQKGKAAE